MNELSAESRKRVIWSLRRRDFKRLTSRLKYNERSNFGQSGRMSGRKTSHPQRVRRQGIAETHKIIDLKEIEQ